MINLSLNKLKQIAKVRSIKDYKNKSKEYLTKIFNGSKPIKPFYKENRRDKTGFSELRYRFFKSKINEFIRSLYNIKIQKSLPAPKIKETKKNLFELEKSPNNLKRNLFNEVDEDYYNPIKTKSAFNGNYIKYQSKGVKDKNLVPEEYLDIIRPYLSNMINDHKTRRDSEETRTRYTKSHNIEIMKGKKIDEIIEKLIESLLQNYQKNLEEPMRGSKFVPDSIDLLYYHLQKVG